MESISGQIVEFIRANGRTIEWAEKANIHGKMVGNIKGNIAMIRSKDTACIRGRMAKFIKASGCKANSMAKVFSILQTAKK